MHRLLAGFLLLIIAFECIAQSDVKEIVLSELAGFGVQITQMGIKENREQSVNLRFSVPKVDGNNCSVSDIELTIEKDGQFIAHNFLSNMSESTKDYSSHIVATKAEGLAFSIGARYSCKNQITSSIFYKFGDLIEIEKHFRNNGIQKKYNKSLNFVPATKSVAPTGLPPLRCGSQLAKRYTFGEHSCQI